MAVRLLYFAWVRERTGISNETVELPAGLSTVADLMGWLKNRGPNFAAAFERMDVIRTAVNQTHVPHSTNLIGAREIAFFPPVTGG